MSVKYEVPTVKISFAMLSEKSAVIFCHRASAVSISINVNI
jgi:hypothetical protein